jgi:fructokinase
LRDDTQTKNKSSLFMSLLWGIDLGGTKIEGVVIEPASNNVLLRRRIATEREGGYEHILHRIKSLVDQLREEIGEGPDRIGIGTPGAVEPSTGLLKNSNTLCLNDQPIVIDLEKLLEVPVRIANDANCFAVAETRMGVVARQELEAKVVFGVIMGTGCGGGLVLDGKVWNGKQGIAGEWGHNFLDESGGPCYCGRSGCVEAVISGPSLERFYKEQSGQEKALKEIVADARSKADPVAVQTLERLIVYFGKAIAPIINILDPDVIVLGGGLGNIDELYTRGVQEAAAHIFNSELNTVFLKPELGDSAGVFGAAFLW